ncbi:MAG: hypothetical protein ACRDU0_16705, partial [Mycobacterium sp.]
ADLFYGWFAVPHRSFPGSGVYHVDVTRPPGNIVGGNIVGATNQGEAVFAVQTATTPRTGLINYVVVASISSGGKTYWVVGYSHGHLANAALDTLATVQVSPDVTTESVTLRTDGARSLQVWFGHDLVYSSNSLAMHIAPPYQPYLEVQSRQVAYVSSFANYWITSGSSLDVDGVPAGKVVALSDTSGRTVSFWPADSSGVARLPLNGPDGRGTGYIVITRGGRNIRLGPFDYSGGSHYHVQ